MQSERPCPPLAADFQVDLAVVLLAARGVTRLPIGPGNWLMSLNVHFTQWDYHGVKY